MKRAAALGLALFLTLAGCMDIGNKNLFDPQIFQSQNAARNINNRVDCSDFVKMHFINSFSVNLSFSFC